MGEENVPPVQIFLNYSGRQSKVLIHGKMLPVTKISFAPVTVDSTVDVTLTLDIPVVAAAILPERLKVDEDQLRTLAEMNGFRLLEGGSDGE